MSPATDPSTALHAAGLRVTRQRIAVLESLDQRPHATVEQLARSVRQELGAVSTQAVYDVLSSCVRVGLVRRIEPAGHSALFETRTADNHHHMVCHSCGIILDVDCAVGAAPCLDVADWAGFTVHEAEIVFWGTCPRCTTAGVTRPGNSRVHATYDQPPNDQPPNDNGKEDRS